MKDEIKKGIDQKCILKNAAQTALNISKLCVLYHQISINW